VLWSDLVGHRDQLEWFRTAVASGRLATSFLFVGPAGIGKRTFARLLAKSLLCRNSPTDRLEPCDACEDCAQVDASTHPDLIQISKPQDRAFIPIELLIGERDKRMREGLCHDISLRPYSGRRKIAILDDCDALNVEGANALLKTLEEPPLDSILILVGTSLQRQLPTIRSRCQAIIFRQLATADIQQLLVRSGHAEAEAQRIASAAGGSLEKAKQLADEEFQEFRNSLLAELIARPMNFSGLAKSCGAMVDAAGNDTREKRRRLQQVFSVASELYRAITLKAAENENERAGELAQADPNLNQAINAALSSWTTGTQGAIQCWQRCLTAIEDCDRNANQTALLETWAADLAYASKN